MIFDLHKISQETFLNSKQMVGQFALNFQQPAPEVTWVLHIEIINIECEFSQERVVY